MPWRWLGRTGVFVWMSLLVACTGGGAVAPVSNRDSNLRLDARYYTVKKDDTLYSVAWQYGRDFKEVARWNGIQPPYHLNTGQRITVMAPVEQKASPPPSAETVTKPAESANRKPPRAANAKRRQPASSSAATRGQAVRWQWPVQGKVVRTFSANDSGKKGLDIAGDIGQPVVAAARGRVVYSGSGLIGYGKLIIIKHDERYLSAYANNRRLLVREGDEVTIGQRIAEMGRSGAKNVMLHFEIRRDGRPVDPLYYLPKRES